MKPSRLLSLSRATLAVALVSFAFCTAGCSSGTTSTPAGSGAVTADVCASRCEAKYTTCGAAADTAKRRCASQVCNVSPSSDELTCLETKSCDDIARAISFVSLCAPGRTCPRRSGLSCGGCASDQYCALGYDASTMTWNTASCKAIPTACVSKGPVELCECMSKSTGCPTSGAIETKCDQLDDGLTFGCN